MEGKILRNYILSTGIWTVFIMGLITYASRTISNIYSSILVVFGLVILWLLVNTFTIVQFLKRGSR